MDSCNDLPRGRRQPPASAQRLGGRLLGLSAGSVIFVARREGLEGHAFDLTAYQVYQSPCPCESVVIILVEGLGALVAEESGDKGIRLSTLQCPGRQVMPVAVGEVGVRDRYSHCLPRLPIGTVKK